MPRQDFPLSAVLGAARTRAPVLPIATAPTQPMPARRPAQGRGPTQIAACGADVLAEVVLVSAALVHAWSNGKTTLAIINSGRAAMMTETSPSPTFVRE